MAGSQTKDYKVTFLTDSELLKADIRIIFWSRKGPTDLTKIIITITGSLNSQPEISKVSSRQKKQNKTTI